LNFEKIFGTRKLRALGLSWGVVCMFLCLAILVELRLVTDTHTDRHTTMAYTAESIARVAKRHVPLATKCSAPEEVESKKQRELDN